MLMRTAAAVFALSLVSVAASDPAHAEADELCKPGHVLDSGRQLCYDPAAAYRPNLPQQQPVFGSGTSAAPSEAKPQANAPANPQTNQAQAPQSSDGGIFGWLKDQARFCRFGDRQVGSGDAAYCVDRSGKSYPAGK